MSPYGTFLPISTTLSISFTILFFCCYKNGIFPQTHICQTFFHWRKAHKHSCSIHSHTCSFPFISFIYTQIHACARSVLRYIHVNRLNFFWLLEYYAIYIGSFGSFKKYISNVYNNISEAIFRQLQWDFNSCLHFFIAYAMHATESTYIFYILNEISTFRIICTNHIFFHFKMATNNFSHFI